MDYFKLDYSNVKTELAFNHYADFILNNTMYKYYLFDLSLAVHDKNLPTSERNEALKITRIQKILTLVPYTIIGGVSFICWRRNIFKINDFEREHKIFFNFFMLILLSRMAQKAVLKYQGDKLLIPIYNRNHRTVVMNSPLETPH